MSTITAIITTHRRPQLLLRALDSLRAERRRPDEILVVEDGEDPGLPSLLAGTGIPCRLLQRPLSSVSKARNLGLREAKCDWVIYLDDDDIVYGHRLAELEAAAERNPSAFVFGGTLKVLPERRYRVPTHHPEDDAEATFADILCCMPHTNSTLFSRRELLACGGFVEASTYFSDWCAMLHLVDRGRAWRVPGVLSEFEAVSGGMTHAVAGGQAMREKVLEAFDLLRIQEAAHRRLVDRVRAAVERSEPFSSYDDYVEMASRLLSRP
jgi:glycosyltransferase involved in cell wall biosynthesis